VVATVAVGLSAIPLTAVSICAAVASLAVAVRSALIAIAARAGKDGLVQVGAQILRLVGFTCLREQYANEGFQTRDDNRL
jgi:hypothetical protein